MVFPTPFSFDLKFFSISFFFRCYVCILNRWAFDGNYSTNNKYNEIINGLEDGDQQTVVLLRRTLKFKAPKTNSFLATVNQVFGGSS